MVRRILMAILVGVFITACAPSSAEPVEEDEHSEHDEHSDDEHSEHDEHGDHEHDEEAEMLTLPTLEAVDLGGEPLQVVATTSIIGDVVEQVGGENIELTTLMGPGQDPHSYEPAARDLTQAADAHVIFVNGWDLEEGLAGDLETIGEDVPVAPIAANIEPLEFGGHTHDEDEHDDEHGDEHGDHEHSEDEHGDHEHGEDEHGDEHSEDEHGDHEHGEDEHGDEHSEDEHGDHEHGEDEHSHDHGSADPHTWFDVENVKQWALNAAEVLSALDPANADTYAANADAYIAELEELDTYTQEQVEAIPTEERLLVTNHDSFSYFAEAYGFEILGTVIPGTTTVAEPSARDLAGLIDTMAERDVCTIFTETTVSDDLAQTVADELDECEAVQVLSLYTGAVGPEGSGAESYVSMFRANVDTIVQGLQQP